MLVGKVSVSTRRLGSQGAPAAPPTPLRAGTRAWSRRRRGGRPGVVAASSFGSAAEAAPYLAAKVDWAVEVTRHTLTMPLVGARGDA